MNDDIIQIILFTVLLIALVKPIGLYMSAVYQGRLRIGKWRIEDTEYRVFACLASNHYRL